MEPGFALDRPFLKKYGFSVTGYFEMLKSQPLKGPKLVELRYSYGGGVRHDKFFLKITKHGYESEIAGYLENPGISAPLVFKDDETQGIMTAVVGKPLYEVLSERSSQKLLKKLGSAIRKLKTKHGDLNLTNCIKVESVYGGPSISSPDEDEPIVFIDYKSASNNDKTKEIDVFDVATRLSKDLYFKQRDATRSCASILEGFGASAGEILSKAGTTPYYDRLVNNARGKEWRTSTVCGFREAVLAFDELAKR